MSAPTDTDPPTITLYDVVRGATWPGIPTIGPLVFLPDGELVAVPPSAPAVAAELVFYKLGSTLPAIRLGTEAGCAAPITIHGDGSNWDLAIPPVNPDVWTLGDGRYSGYLKITDADGTVWATHLIRQTILPDPPKQNTP